MGADTSDRFSGVRVVSGAKSGVLFSYRDTPSQMNGPDLRSATQDIYCFEEHGLRSVREGISPIHAVPPLRRPPFPVPSSGLGTA